MIKDYAKKITIVPASSRRHWSVWGLVIVTILICTIFALVLIRATFNNKIVEPSQVQVKSVVPIEKIEASKPIIIIQTFKPNFTFPVMLKKAKVTPPFVKAYESTPKDPTKKTSHILQVASFRTESDAKELKKRLIRKKLTNVQVTQSTADSGTIWFRVMVGPFQNRSMLNKAQDILVQMNFSPLERKQK